MPTMGGARSSLADFGVGLAGGAVYALSTAFTGSGFLGGIIGAVVAGSVVKGVRGTVVATTLGFQTIVGAAQAASGKSSGTPQAEVM